MDGIQQTVVIELQRLIENIEAGNYGINDSFLQDPDDRNAFYQDFEDNVIGSTL